MAVKSEPNEIEEAETNSKCRCKNGGKSLNIVSFPQVNERIQDFCFQPTLLKTRAEATLFDCLQCACACACVCALLMALPTTCASVFVKFPPSKKE